MSPAGLATRSATEYGKPGNLVEMIKQNLITERIAAEHYSELIRYFSDRDPTTRIMLEKLWRRKKNMPLTCMTSSWRMKERRFCKTEIGQTLLQNG